MPSVFYWRVLLAILSRAIQLEKSGELFPEFIKGENKVRTHKLFCILSTISLSTLLIACSEPFKPTPITSLDSLAPDFIGKPAVAQSLTLLMPSHPFMSAQGVNAMHADSYSSDAHPGGGPLGINIQKQSRIGTREPGGQCATLTFDSGGRLVALCAGMSGFRIHLLTPRKLELLAEYKLPTRPSTYEAIIHRDKSKIMEDSSGAYFYLDDQDRVVMADSAQVIQRIAHQQNKEGGWEFYNDGRWDLSEIVPHDCLSPTNPFPKGECDPITAVMPDYKGLIWWVTRNGRLGTLNTENGNIRSIQLDGEEIQNGFSVAENGVFIVSDHAMYRFEADSKGMPKEGWREVYDRGSSRKVGTINQGSGTTPTLLSERYVTLTDNADGKINLLVYRREQHFTGNRLICKLPLFEENHSVTDNSMIAFGRSIVLENNAGYTHSRAQQDWENAGGGIVRVDIRKDESGCDLVWKSKEHSPSVVPKLSIANGLAYFYSFITQKNGENAWYLTALDFRTGKTQFKILTGVGRDFDNNWAPLTLGLDGTAYMGVAKGIVALWDGVSVEKIVEKN